MIHEITGQPGHGKTLYALYLALQFVKEGRAVYAHGVKDLKYGPTGFIALDDPRAWEALPDNSVVLIDECYSTFPNRNMATTPPPYVEAMARHRHRGFDFLLVHQQPNQVDPFVRGLVDRHTHVRRKFGMNAAVLKEWDYSSPNPLKDEPLRKPLWRYPKAVYDLYTSATMHTVKRRIPWYVWALIPMACYVFYVYHKLTTGPVVPTPEALSKFAGAAPPAGAATQGAVSVGGAASRAAQGDYVTWVRPRQGGIPWTAPAYENLAPQSKPELYCMVSSAGTDAQGRAGAGGCTCLTEQGTRAEVASQDCERYAVDGLYNPYRRVLPERELLPRPASPLSTDLHPEEPAVAVGTTSTEQVASYGGFRQ